MYFLVSTMLLLDLFGAIASLSATILFISVNRLAWLITAVATLLNGWLYWQQGIYADMTLEVAYFASAIYGWISWRKSKYGIITEIKTMSSLQEWLILLGTLSFIYCLLWFFLSTYTNTNVAALDAATTALSLVAQWLMCRKVILTWVLWFITDTIYVYLYYIKELPFHALLVLIYLGLALIGYFSWRQRLVSGYIDAAPQMTLLWNLRQRFSALRNGS